jgi:hypothetical protein
MARFGGRPLAVHSSSTSAFDETVLECRPLAAHSSTKPKQVETNLALRAIEKHKHVGHQQPREKQRAEAAEISGGNRATNSKRDNPTTINIAFKFILINFVFITNIIFIL